MLPWGRNLTLPSHVDWAPGFLEGEGFILQRLRGDGMAFVHAGGSVIKKELNNEVLRVDTGCLVAFSSSVDYNIEMVKGFKINVLWR